MRWFLALGLAFVIFCLIFSPFWREAKTLASMSYPQGYLYQPPGSLALYSCPTGYGASALAAPRSEELARSSSGSAFSPYPGSAAFSASASGFSSPLPYPTDPATGLPSYMVNTLGKVLGYCGYCQAKCCVWKLYKHRMRWVVNLTGRRVSESL